jgi:hypothetical protein
MFFGVGSRPFPPSIFPPNFFLVLEYATYVSSLNKPQMAWKHEVALVLAKFKKQSLHWRVKLFLCRRRSISFNFDIWKPYMPGDARKQRRYGRWQSYRQQRAPLRAEYPHLPCFLGVLVSVYNATAKSFQRLRFIFFVGCTGVRRDGTTGGIRPDQKQLWLARALPQLAPAELETVRAWLRPTHYAWSPCALLTGGSKFSEDPTLKPS